MLVKDLMSSPAITVESTDLLSDVIPMLVRTKMSGVPVLDASGALIGILSEGDLLRRVELGTGIVKDHWWTRLFTSDSPAEHYRRAHGRKVSDVMSTDVVTIDAGETLAEAARLMKRFGVKRLPVVSEGRVVGMLTRADFLKALAQYMAPAYEEQAVSDDELRERIEAEIAHQKWAVDCTIHVAIDNGNAVLTGSVDSDEKRKAIVVAAENVYGVRSVEDKIEVVQPAVIYGF